MTTRHPNTFMVGAGPVATALAGALRLGGIPVLGLWARKPQAARTAGAISGVASYSAAPPDLLLEADVVILAVRDHAIAEVADMLVNTGLITTRHVMLHCAGVTPAAEAFAAVRGRVGGIGTLHPLRALADARKGMHSMAGTVFGMEGDERGVSMATILVKAVKGKPLLLSAAQMAAYHAAAAMASNFLVALMDTASSLLVNAGMSEAEAMAALVPLAQGSLSNIGERGVVGGLTGPIRRGDVATVERHLSSLESLPEVMAMYRTLGLRTVEVARRVGDVEERDLDAIAALLQGVRPAGAPATEVDGSADRGKETDIESRAYQA